MAELQPTDTAPRDGTEILAKDYETEDWKQSFEPLFLVDIDSDGGNIGRFYWQNQCTLVIEQWGENDFYEEAITTLPGYCAWLFNYACWIGWCMGGFCP